MPKRTLGLSGDEDAEIAEGVSVATEASAKVEEAVLAAPDTSRETFIPVTVVTEVDGLWRLEWTDAVGRLRQSWSPDRLERSTLSYLASLPPHGDDLATVLVEICLSIDVQVTTLHWMNIWEKSQITYQVLRDMLASRGGAEYIALEARVQALGAERL